MFAFWGGIAVVVITINKNENETRAVKTATTDLEKGRFPGSSIRNGWNLTFGMGQS